MKKIHANPIYRAVRSDKITLALLDETLRQYNRNSVHKNNIALRLLSTKRMMLKKRGEKILSALSKSKIKLLGLSLQTSKVEAGSGSLPVQNLESMALYFSCKSQKPGDLASAFRQAKYPVLGYVKQNHFFIDLKAILPSQIDCLIQTISEIK
jgi:L-seryl-tRNA(Ser) seleniumtransferase